MATVTIRNLDEKVVEELKALAKQHNRSLEAELRTLLEDAAQQRERAKAFWEEADRIRAMTPKDRPQTDSVILIREDRER